MPLVTCSFLTRNVFSGLSSCLMPAHLPISTQPSLLPQKPSCFCILRLDSCQKFSQNGVPLLQGTDDRWNWRLIKCSLGVCLSGQTRANCTRAGMPLCSLHDAQCLVQHLAHSRCSVSVAYVWPYVLLYPHRDFTNTHACTHTYTHHFY